MDATDRPDGAALPTALIVAVVVAGVALRVGILVSPLGRTDADEVVAGLMARHLFGEGSSPFFWGQHYGGTIQLLPVALSMKLFGSSVLAMRLPTLVLGAVNAYLLTRVARRFLARPQAQLAGLLLWIGPPAAVWFGIHEQVFYQPTVLFGLLLAIFAFRTREADRMIDYALLGLIGGLGWWTSSNIVYFLLPAVVILVRRPEWKRRKRALLGGAALAFAGAVVGALPWIIDCLHSDFAPLRAGGTFPVIGTYGGRFTYFFTDALPGVLGFRETFTYRWIAGPVGVAAALGLFGLLAFAAWRALRSLDWDGVGVVVFPFVFAFLPMVMDDPNMRYLFWIVPFVAVLVARLAVTRRLVYVALALTLLITGVGLQRMYAVSETQGPENRIGKIGDLGPALEILDEQHLDAVNADYWVAYRITFESGERIIAAPSWGVERYEPYKTFVRGSSRSAWVVSTGDQEQALLDGLARLGVTAQVFPAGEVAVVVPSRPVLPTELPDRARYGL